jgi:protocatechuate 3,4-dioxygenase, beta subunit
MNPTIAQQGKVTVGGPCEGCEAVYEYGDRTLNSQDTLPDFTEPGPRMKITGIIYRSDGKTPAKDVVLYIYHTDQSGVYPTRGDERNWARRHGYLRGWIKTDESGRYTFYTLKPASYPERNAPAHIHATVKEPGMNEYWIDEYLFEGDPLLTATERKSQKGRCGTGIITLKKDSSGILVAERNIVLGLNIPNYSN